MCILRYFILPKNLYFTSTATRDATGDADENAEFSPAIPVEGEEKTAATERKGVFSAVIHVSSHTNEPRNNNRERDIFRDVLATRFFGSAEEDEGEGEEARGGRARVRGEKSTKQPDGVYLQESTLHARNCGAAAKLRKRDDLLSQ